MKSSHLAVKNTWIMQVQQILDSTDGFGDFGQEVWI